MDDIRVAFDTVNGCSLHPYLNLMAVATGNNNGRHLDIAAFRTLAFVAYRPPDLL